MASYDPHALFSCLCKDLSESVGDTVLDNFKNGVLDWPDMTFQQRAASSIYQSLFKKYESGLNDETKRKALIKFLQINSDCGSWVKPVCEQVGDSNLMGELKQLLYDFWTTGKFRYPLVEHDYDVLCKGAVGPGAAIGSPGGDFFSKLFSSDLTCSSKTLYFWYRRYIRNFPEWAAAEETRKLTYGEGVVTTSNRLSFVPKNDDISRSICTEPVLNMFYQLGLGNILTKRLHSTWGIDLEVQQFKNRELARKGSLDESFATIDLSSASDSISLNMLREVLPPDFLRWLERYRSTTSKLPNGELVGLNMISTMGNGYTFPLQTILFTAVVLSAFKVDGLAPIFPFGNSEGNFGVNGDDIVIPKRIYAKVTRLLCLLGFKLNIDKTFVEGPFRESCGGDYFKGRNLRGVYIKRLRGPHDSYAVINQLNQFSTRTGILLPRLVGALLKKVRFLPVPMWEKDDAGIRVPFAMVRKQMRLDRDTQSILYFAWTPKPPPAIRICDNALFIPNSFKPRQFNLPGLFVSFLQRSVNGHRIPLLPKEVFYSRKPRIAPCWDTPALLDTSTIQLFGGWFDWSRWKTVAYLNLVG